MDSGVVSQSEWLSESLLEPDHLISPGADRLTQPDRWIALAFSPFPLQSFLLLALSLLVTVTPTRDSSSGWIMHDGIASMVCTIDGSALTSELSRSSDRRIGLTI